MPEPLVLDPLARNVPVTCRWNPSLHARLSLPDQAGTRVQFAPEHVEDVQIPNPLVLIFEAFVNNHHPVEFQQPVIDRRGSLQSLRGGDQCHLNSL
jgi:hypothetical protein